MRPLVVLGAGRGLGVPRVTVLCPRPSFIIPMSSSSRQAAEQFWLVLGHRADDVGPATASEISRLQACITAALPHGLPPGLDSDSVSREALYEWLVCLARSMSAEHSDEAAVFLNRLFRAVTTTRGGFGAINKRIEKRIPESVVCRAASIACSSPTP